MRGRHRRTDWDHYQQQPRAATDQDSCHPHVIIRFDRDRASHGSLPNSIVFLIAVSHAMCAAGLAPVGLLIHRRGGRDQHSRSGRHLGIPPIGWTRTPVHGLNIAFRLCSPRIEACLNYGRRRRKSLARKSNCWRWERITSQFQNRHNSTAHIGWSHGEHRHARQGVMANSTVPA